MTTVEMQTIVEQVVERINSHIPQQWGRQILKAVEQNRTATPPDFANDRDLLSGQCVWKRG